MTVIITDTGFAQDDWAGSFTALDDFIAGAPANDAETAVDLASDAEPKDLAGKLDGIDMIRVDFPSFADGAALPSRPSCAASGFRAVCVPAAM